MLSAKELILMRDEDLQNLVNFRQDLSDEEKLALLEQLRSAAKQLDLSKAEETQEIRKSF